MRRLTLVALALAALASAVPRCAAAGVQVGTSVFAAYNTHAMGDWADLMAGARLPPGDFERVRSGISMGVSPQLLWGEHVGLAVAYERLDPSEKHDGRGRKLRLPANAFLVSLELKNRLVGPLRLGAAAGAGWYLLGHEVEISPGGPDLGGSGVGAHALEFAEWPLTPATSLRLEVGYRSAIVKVDEINQLPPRVGSEPLDLLLDYSGWTVRTGVLFHTRIR